MFKKNKKSFIIKCKPVLLQYKTSHSRNIKSASETGNVGFASLNCNKIIKYIFIFIPLLKIWIYILTSLIISSTIPFCWRDIGSPRVSLEAAQFQKSFCYNNYIKLIIKLDKHLKL